MMLRILWLVANRGVAPSEVLGLTFTRKAAGELRERVEAGLERLRLARHLDGDDDARHLRRPPRRHAGRFPIERARTG